MIFSSFLSSSLIKKALDDQKIEVDCFNFRQFSVGKHQKVDSPPFGGGAGMVLRPEPIINSLEYLEKKFNKKGLHKVLLTPQGKTFNQGQAKQLSKTGKPIVLICGRYEGFDERIRDFVDEELSLGDFILLGGETAAMCIIEAVSRNAPGVISEDSLGDESFTEGLLEYAQYTKPRSFKNLLVPDVLLGGNHLEIKKWRQANAVERTKNKRPDIVIKDKAN